MGTPNSEHTRPREQIQNLDLENQIKNFLKKQKRSRASSSHGDLLPRRCVLPKTKRSELLPPLERFQ